ncbi:MAG: hypothetical protein H6708_22880 [Kofleriaceae bacterium]|nr:hypothetical protein [Myxococcales bacterium]MCB9563253.1 hypothetical protein [Kofleriaceae bacterium]
MSLQRSLARACVVVLVAVAALGGCEKVDHGNLDKWMNTAKGPDKIRKALADGSIDPDLSAHAAENLLRLNEEDEVLEVLRKLGDDRRAKVLAKLAPRLWKLARIEGELTEPNGLQITAKDALFDLRDLAKDATHAEIDGYLIEWFTGGYYEGRAGRGRWSGAQVMRAIGAAAGEKMIAAANAVVGAPAKDGRRIKIGDELMLGLAVTGHPDAVKYVLDIAGMTDRGDKSLPERAVSALYLAYVEPPSQLFPVADGAALVPQVDVLERIAKDHDSSPRMVNDAVALIRAAGPPACIEPLVALVAQPHDDPMFMWVGANNALRCGGPGSIVAVAEALPASGQFWHEELEGGVVGEIARMSAKDKVQAEARKLLDSRSWVARWVGVEVLGKVGTKEDADRLAALGKDKARLVGYWGDQSGLDKKDRKADPTLGQRAAEVAAALRGAP